MSCRAGHGYSLHGNRVPIGKSVGMFRSAL
ncbi:uncharacterized protein METZ01_LOCUS442423 [marine metagenome]|uniref:Uncharacterized protein n=1 Tax=marine metagenome TaxID=408172 RepID=A0A382Z300_9ZZZZ